MQPSINRKIAARKRPDLQSVQCIRRRDAEYVVKDPIAMSYHRMRVDEHYVLSMLDGKTSLRGITDGYNEQFNPRRVRAADINRLILRFNTLGLLLSGTGSEGQQLLDRRHKQAKQRWFQRLSGLLFIRFPGVDAEPILRRLYPICRPALGTAGGTIYAVTIVAATFILVTSSDRFARELGSIDRWLTAESLLTLAVVIGISKVLHELGHAIACKHFGGECHQIGPMLLAFTPALYCDTSDSWLLPSRWQRAAVGAAGMAVEVSLAAAATILWWATDPGLTQAIAIQVIVVCGVSTLLCNANPLLRYDGYYILSDLCETPNLGERSKRLLSQLGTRLLFGVVPQDDEIINGWNRFWMLVYAIAAFVYRWALTLFILYVVTRLLRPLRLESVGWTLAIFSAASIVVMILQPAAQFVFHPAKRGTINRIRTSLSAVMLAGLSMLFFIPIPEGISFSGRIVPTRETPVYIVAAGQLQRVVKKPGDHVVKGELIATLINPSTSLEHTTAVGRYETQLTKLEAIRGRAVDEPETLRDLPAQEAFLNELREQRDRRLIRVESLQILAPATGRLLAGPPVESEREDDPLRLVGWQGTPTLPQNEGCWLRPGTELMSVQVGNDYDAVAVLSQSKVQRFAIGSKVRLFTTDRPAKVFEGTVTAINAIEYDSRTDAMRRDDPKATESGRPAEISYSVSVRIETDDRLIVDIPCQGRIAAEASSLFSRARRLLNEVLRFH